MCVNIFFSSTYDTPDVMQDPFLGTFQGDVGFNYYG